jgi:hypothetical protein
MKMKKADKKAYKKALKFQTQICKYFTYVSDMAKSGNGEQFDEESEKLLAGIPFIGDCDTATNTVAQACHKTQCFSEDKILLMVTPNHYIGGVVGENDVWVFENTGYEYTMKALDDPNFGEIVLMPTKDKYKYGYIEPKVYRLSELQKGLVIPEKRGKAFMIPAKIKKYYMEQFATLDEGMGGKWWTQRDDLPFLVDFKMKRDVEVPSAELINAPDPIPKYWFTKEWEASFTLNVGFFKVEADYDSERKEKLKVEAAILGHEVYSYKASGESIPEPTEVKAVKEYGAVRQWQGIVVHESSSSWGTEKDIYNWHVHGNGWDDTGYHFVITNENYNNHLRLPFMNGSVSAGRNLSKSGAHTLYGYNKTHIGICCIHNSQPNRAQASTLFRMCKHFMNMYNFSADKVIGHNEVQNKTCPGFKVEYLRDALIADDESMFVNLFKD